MTVHNDPALFKFNGREINTRVLALHRFLWGDDNTQAKGVGGRHACPLEYRCQTAHRKGAVME